MQHAYHTTDGFDERSSSVAVLIGSQMQERELFFVAHLADAEQEQYLKLRARSQQVMQGLLQVLHASRERLAGTG